MPKSLSIYFSDIITIILLSNNIFSISNMPTEVDSYNNVWEHQNRIILSFRTKPHRKRFSLSSLSRREPQRKKSSHQKGKENQSWSNIILLSQKRSEDTTDSSFSFGQWTSWHLWRRKLLLYRSEILRRKNTR